MPEEASPHRVVIIGCGFGGLFAARALRRAPVQITVIDRTNHHLFQPLLYQLATGILSSGEIAPPIRDVLRRQHNTSVLLGDVVGIDAERRSLAVRTLASQWEIGYDSLIVATGAAQSYFGHDEFAAAAPGLKTLDDALEIRAVVLAVHFVAYIPRVLRSLHVDWGAARRRAVPGAGIRAMLLAAAVGGGGGAALALALLPTINAYGAGH